MFTKTIHSDFSGHTLFVQEVAAGEIPAFITQDGGAKFYAVHNNDEKGVIFMYLARYRNAPKEITAWYPKGGFWSGYGTAFKSAIEGAQKDGWMCA